MVRTRVRVVTRSTRARGSYRLAPVLTAVAVIAGVACGRMYTPPGVGDQPASSVRTTPTPAVTPGPINDWNTYSSARWGYSVQYPAGWLEISNCGAPDSEKYFSNEKLGCGQDADSNGVINAISVSLMSGQSCPYREPPPAAITRQDDVTVDGVSAKLDIMTATADLEIYLDHNGYCYRSIYLFRRISTLNATESTAVTMLGTFKFGQPPKQ